MNWQLIVGVLCLIGGIGNILEDFFAFLFGVASGALFLYLGIKKKILVKQSNSSEVHESRTLCQEDFKAVGISYYESNIQKLANVNPDWKLSTAQIVMDGKTDRKIYHYNYVNKPVKLIREPNNIHDENAIAVQIAGELVGYISREDNVYVRDILENREIIAISGFVGGGEYKIVSENKDVFKSSIGNNVTVRIRYV